MALSRVLRTDLPLKQSFRLALPLVLSNLSVPLLGLVDTALLGRLPGPEFLAAGALGAAAMSVISWCFGFLRTSTTGFTAQAYGGGEQREIGLIAIRAALTALAVGLVVLAFAPIYALLVQIVFQPSATVAGPLETYVDIRLLSVPAMLLNIVAIGWFIGRQRPMAPMALLIFTNGINAALSVFFVFVLEMGIEGVALGTVCADYSGTALALFLAIPAYRRLNLARILLSDILAWSRLLVFFSLSRDVFLRTLLLQIAFLTFNYIGMRQGDLMLAANAVLINFIMLQAHGLDGFADAAEAMAGRAVGRRRVDELRGAVLACLFSAGIMAIGLTFLFSLGGPMLIVAMTDQVAVREAAFAFLPYVCVAPLIGIWAFVFDGVFFGATRGPELRNAMAVATSVFLLAAASLSSMWGNHGLWIAFLLFLGARGLILAMIYLRAGRGAGFVPV